MCDEGSLLGALVNWVVILIPVVGHKYLGWPFQSVVLVLLAVVAFQMLRECPS
ncbi:hypothetical protein [Halopelagius fulvigenes]|uniref:Uncharacterized protein n=1 Tax=Halopelagius fulvigenes TaxID=1198324 RepID=A0ABD5U2E2_9EURY